MILLCIGAGIMVLELGIPGAFAGGLHGLAIAGVLPPVGPAGGLGVAVLSSPCGELGTAPP